MSRIMDFDVWNGFFLELKSRFHGSQRKDGGPLQLGIHASRSYVDVIMIMKDFVLLKIALNHINVFYVVIGLN